MGIVNMINLQMSPNQLQVQFYPGQANVYSSHVRIPNHPHCDRPVALHLSGGQLLVSFGCMLPSTQWWDVYFASASGTASSSYWDYVAYSDAFLPVPEPSSMLALAGGIAGITAFALRRKRR